GASHQLVRARDPRAVRPSLRVLTGELGGIVEVLWPAHCPVGQAPLEHTHTFPDAMPWRRHVRWIEEEEGLPSEADLDRVLHVRARRHRMKHADGRARPEPGRHLPAEAL